MGPVAMCMDYYLGAVYRVQIWRRDETTDTCALLRLFNEEVGIQPVWPELSLPEYLWYERALVRTGAADCHGDPFGGAEPLDVAGTVVSYARQPWYLPESVDVDVTLSFEPVEPGIPASVSMQVEGLAVSDDCEQPSGWVTVR